MPTSPGEILRRAPDKRWPKDIYVYGRELGFWPSELDMMTWLRLILNEAGEVVGITGGSNEPEE